MNIVKMNMIFSAGAVILTGAAWAISGSQWLAFLCGANLVFFLAHLRDILTNHYP